MLKLGRLDRVGDQIANPALLREPTLRREAQSTSALEGTYAPLESVIAADRKDVTHLSPEMREIVNYILAADLAFRQFDAGRRTTGAELRELHRVLVEGTEADGDQAGRIRDIIVAIGPRRRPITESRFVPHPPGPLLEIEFNDWMDWFNAVTPFDGDPISGAALAHYQFETLHPFNDGNGRLGRLMVVVMLLQRNVLTQPILAISPWFEAHRMDYQDHLARVSETGDFSPWVEFFATGLAASAQDAADHANQMLAIQSDLRERVRLAKSSKSQIAIGIVDEVLGLPIFTIKQMADRLGVGAKGVGIQVEKLTEMGVLSQYGNSTYNRQYTAPELLRSILAW